VADRLALGVTLSLVLHALLLVLALFLMPILAGRFASPAPVVPPQVLKFRFSDRTADVDVSSRVDRAPDTPLTGRHASRARDRVRDDADTPLPSSDVRMSENALPGDAASEPRAKGDASSRSDAEASPSAPVPGQEAVLDGLRSETALLTGKRTAPPRAAGGGPGARTMEGVDDGALQFGDFAFSTTAWEFEPYWYYMRQRLYAHWHPPAAYRDYGIIQGGWTMVRATLDRQGRLLDCRVLGTKGHESLHPASFAAMQGAAPFRPLPVDFPDDSLVVTVKFIYMQPGMQRPSPVP
jgi:outer membrane biosynthesis protein TonB